MAGSLRNIIRRPLSSSSSRHILPLSLPQFASSPNASSSLPLTFVDRIHSALFRNHHWMAAAASSLERRRSFSASNGGLIIGSLTDTRFPKRRPGTKPRRKRASLRPPGPFAWVQYVPGEPIPRSRPNEGSVQGRNRKKRIAQRKAFILSEKKKRKAQFAESKKKKAIERIERKMSAVARDKAWAQRLIELQQLEAEKKAATA